MLLQFLFSSLQNVVGVDIDGHSYCEQQHSQKSSPSGAWNVALAC